MGVPLTTGDEAGGELGAEYERRTANLQSVAAFFRAHPHQWIESKDLERIGGRCAWRTRVSECRTKFAMSIDNRQERGPDVVLSWYRFTPRPEIAPAASLPAQPELFDSRRGCFSE